MLHVCVLVFMLWCACVHVVCVRLCSWCVRALISMLCTCACFHVVYVHLCSCCVGALVFNVCLCLCCS